MTLFRVSHRILKQDDRVFHTTPTLEAKPLLEFLVSRNSYNFG